MYHHVFYNYFKYKFFSFLVDCLTKLLNNESLLLIKPVLNLTSAPITLKYLKIPNEKLFFFFINK